jgi:hypothetical protein
MTTDPVIDRVNRSIVIVLRDGTGGESWRVGTGVLVRLGGREFVFTAAHNVWDGQQTVPVAIATPIGNLNRSLTLKPERMRTLLPEGRDWEGSVEPDVAVIEPTDSAVLSPRREPFDEETIGFLKTDGPSERLLLSGFPFDRIIDHGLHYVVGVGPARPIDPKPYTFDVPSLPRTRASHEPTEGRGLHVFVPKMGKDWLGRVPFPGVSGMSGGPLCRRSGGGVLVGLARSREDHGEGTSEWCEPVVEAIRLLVRHDDPAVALAARRILDRVPTPP